MEVKKIIVHCSASDRPEHDSINVIRQWHIERGFSDIGYHWYINKQGHVFTGRNQHTPGAHCEGQNYDSLGICLGGNKLFTDAQFLALKGLIYTIWSAHGKLPVYGHYEFNPLKNCPNFDVKKLLLT